MTKAEGAVRRQVGALRGADDAARTFGSRVEDRKNKKRVEVGLDKALADLVATVVRLQTHSLPSEHIHCRASHHAPQWRQRKF